MTATDRDSDTWDWLSQRLTPVPLEWFLDLAVRLSISVPGNIVEFGVFKGRSTRIIRGALTRHERFRPGPVRKRIFACDSFKGLPERYEQLPAGNFACERPEIPGVTIVEGLFDESLTPELAATVGRVALAHMDADLYSSTLTALNWLTPLLGTGSLILFDEYLSENESERRALDDWKEATGIRTVELARTFRKPVGAAPRCDQRVLHQVITDEPLEPFRSPMTWRFFLHRFKRRTRNLLARLVRPLRRQSR